MLSLAINANERTRPLIEGAVSAEGIDLVPTVSDPSETFWRQLRFGEFEVSEMSLSSYLIARSRGSDMIAIPVFPSRRFMHTQWSVHADSGIAAPGDLAGKRLGVQEYQQTASVWTRAAFEHDFGVPATAARWFMERTEELSHGGATGFTPPSGISLERIPPDKSLASMLVAHEIDAAPVTRAFQRASNVIDRSTRLRARDGDWSKVRPLFADRVAEGARFFKEHGYVPASHTVVIRGDVFRQHPWVAFNLYRAFTRAKEHARESLEESIPTALVFGRDYLAQTRRLLGDDPFPYGVEANRRMLEDLVRHSREQGLIAAGPSIDELFAPSTVDL